MTQREVDIMIDRFIARAIACEQQRDACEWESRDYWHHHDRAIYWHGKAESLMPGGGRKF